MPVKFAVGDRVLYPDDAEWKSWHRAEGEYRPQPTVAGVVIRVLGDEHVFINDGGGSWHISWLEPVDDFAEWVKEVRDANRL